MALTLRPQTADDTEFLRSVFYSWKADDLGLAMLPPGMLETMLMQQWQIHQHGLAAARPNAQRSIVELDHAPVGVLVVDRSSGVIELCEIALLPGCRNTGAGEALITRLQDEARATGAEIRLHVGRLNRAQNLYRRLGFEPRDDGGAQLPMVWRAA